MPFDRLISWVDDWAVAHDRSDVVAQIGPSEFAPQKLTVIPFMDPPEFRRRIELADCIVAHAGMGSILSALELAKPILVVPRLGALNETRNDHQLATMHRLIAEGLVLGATDPGEFEARMAELETLRESPKISPCASESLLTRLREFVGGDPA